jgi:hypothetical protein
MHGGRFTGAYPRTNSDDGDIKILGATTIGVSVNLFFEIPRTLFFVDCCGEWNRTNSVAPEIFWNNRTQS